MSSFKHVLKALTWRGVIREAGVALLVIGLMVCVDWCSHGPITWPTVLFAADVYLVYSAYRVVRYNPSSLTRSTYMEKVKPTRRMALHFVWRGYLRSKALQGAGSVAAAFATLMLLTGYLTFGFLTELFWVVVMFLVAAYLVTLASLVANYTLAVRAEWLADWEQSDWSSEIEPASEGA